MVMTRIEGSSSIAMSAMTTPSACSEVTTARRLRGNSWMAQPIISAASSVSKRCCRRTMLAAERRRRWLTMRPEPRGYPPRRENRQPGLRSNASYAQLPSRIALDPILEESVARHGGVTLAKLDTDANPRSAAAFGIRGIPAVKGFRDGKVAAEFVGLQPRQQVEQFLNGLAPAAAEPVPGDEAG